MKVGESVASWLRMVKARVRPVQRQVGSSLGEPGASRATLDFSVRRDRAASLGLDLTNPERTIRPKQLQKLQSDAGRIKARRNAPGLDTPFARP